VNGWI